MRAESLGALPGEIFAVRAVEKSAEAVVAGKRLKGRGAKGRRTTKQAILTIFAKRREVVRNDPTLQLRQPSGGRKREGTGGFRFWANPGAASLSLSEGEKRRC
jgi:hypothetical protein